MKPKLILLIAFFSISNYSISQKEIQYGLKAGINISDLTGVTFGWEPRVSIHFGGVLEIPISEDMSIQTELLFSSQGVNDSSFFSDDQIITNYLNLPVNAKYFITEDFSIELGPQLGILLSANSEIDGSDENIKGDLNSLDFGLNTGIEYKFENGLNLGFRYVFGLSNVAKDISSNKIKNGVLQISSGYFF